MSTLQEQVYEYVLAHPSSEPREIDKALKLPPGRSGSTLSVLFGNGLVTRERFHNDSRRASYRYTGVLHEKAKVKRRPRKRMSNGIKGRVLLVLQYGNKESVTLSYTEAREVFEELKQMFIV